MLPTPSPWPPNVKVTDAPWQSRRRDSYVGLSGDAQCRRVDSQAGLCVDSFAFERTRMKE